MTAENPSVEEGLDELTEPTGPESGTGARDEGIVREIGHDEYDPIGTLVLVAIYFLIIGSLYLFMYFVEFLGRGPTPMLI